MALLHAVSLLIVFTALFSFINYKYLKIASAVGVMLVSLLFSVSIVIVGQIAPQLLAKTSEMIVKLNIQESFLEIILSSLLFAGTIHIDTKALLKESQTVFVLAVLAVIISTFVTGSLMHFALGLVGIHIPYIYALLFGALISPTNTVIVTTIFKQAKIPKQLEIDIEGESLFNDSVAVIVFLGILEIAKTGTENLDIYYLLGIFGREALGGIAYGAVLGYIGFRLLKAVHVNKVDFLITLAIVVGGYDLAKVLTVSAPLAVVIAGLTISALREREIHILEVAHNEKQIEEEIEYRKHVDVFWELIDETLNSILFLFIAFEVITIKIDLNYLLAGVIAIVVVLLARFISVTSVIPFTRIKKRRFRTISIFTWGGIRGGMSLALALSLEAQMSRNIIITITYFVVVFSVLFQGLTIVSFVERFRPEPNEEMVEPIIPSKEQKN